MATLARQSIQLENPTIGGRNLWPCSKEFLNKILSDRRVDLSPSYVTGDGYNGFTSRKVTASSSSYLNLVELSMSSGTFEYGDLFTLSFYAKGSGGFDCFFYGEPGHVKTAVVSCSLASDYGLNHYGDGCYRHIVPSTWTKFVVTWKLDTTGDLTKRKIVLFRARTGSILEVCGIKFEKGSVATDWTPATEDKADQAIIDNWTSDAIKDGVTKINGGYIQAQTINSSHLIVEDIFATGSAAMNLISARELNADLITSGTINANFLSLYGLQVLNKTTNQQTLNITENGEITLRGSVESYNYNDGKTGWAIKQNGDAEFNDVVVRGSVITNDGGIVSSGGSGVNLTLTSHVSNKGSTGFTYDSSANIWSGVSPSTDDSSWGTGLYFSSASAKRVVVPAGKKLWITLEAYVNKQVVYTIDVNNQFLTGTASSSNDNDQVSLRTGVARTITANTWTTITCSYTAPTDRDLYDAGSFLGFKANSTIGDVSWKVRNIKMEVGEVPTAFSFSPDEAFKQVRFWAGSSFDEREDAPFIVYNDGSIKATRGEYSGLWTGDVQVGNVTITDPSSTSGNDANITVVNGSSGVQAIQLTDRDTSIFRQAISVRTAAKDSTTEMIALKPDGSGIFNSVVQVGSGASASQLKNDQLVIRGNVLTYNTNGFEVRNKLTVGSASASHDMQAYGDIYSMRTLKTEDGVVFATNDVLKAQIKKVANGLDIDIT